MSLNLHLEYKSNNFELWQTPSYITSMCLTPESDSNGNIAERYMHWVQSHTNGVWTSKDDLDYMRDRVNSHIRELKSFLKKYPNAKFYGL